MGDAYACTWISVERPYSYVAAINIGLLGFVLVIAALVLKLKFSKKIKIVGLILFTIGIFWGIGGYVYSKFVNPEAYDGRPCPEGFYLGSNCHCGETIDHAFLIQDDESPVSKVVIPASDSELVDWLSEGISNSLSWNYDQKPEYMKPSKYFTNSGLYELKRAIGHRVLDKENKYQCQIKATLSNVEISRRGTNKGRYFWVVSAEVNANSGECELTPSAPLRESKKIEILLLHRRVSEEEAAKYANPKNVISPGHMVIERVREKNAAN